MHVPRFIVIVILSPMWWLATTGMAQNVTTVSFSIPSKGTALRNLIFHQEIEGVKLYTEDTTATWNLYQKTDEGWTPQLSQIQRGRPNLLYGRYDDSAKQGDVLHFQWRREKSKPLPAGITIQDDGKSINFISHDSLLMSYRYVDMPVPDGVSQVYSRSGFVHPLKTLQGNILTRIQPGDHYHHYGLWHPWTHTEYDGEDIDFWNLIKEEGTVRFSDVVSRSEGPLFSDLTVIHDHVIHPGRGEQTVLKELLTYRIWTPAETQDYYIIDVLYHMNPSTDKPLIIKKYRYEGFSLRGPAHWNDDNAQLWTSGGKNKTNGNGTRAKWIKVTGPGDKVGKSTVAMMTHPANYNFPELIRIWPTGTNGGKENVFLNFNPTQDRDWILEPGRTYTLQYRVLVSDQDLSARFLNDLWFVYAERSLSEIVPEDNSH